MKTNNTLIKKGDFFVHKKSFSNKFYLNKLSKNLNFNLFKTSRIPFIIGNSNTLNIKTSLYILSKLFKEHKRLNMNVSSNFSLEQLDRFSLKLQTSGFYTSIVETNKKKKLDKIHAKILEFYIHCFLKQYNKNNNGLVSNKFGKEYSAKKGYKNFYQTIKPSKFIQPAQKNSLSILRKKYTRILESRVLLYLKTHKKKYNSAGKQVGLNKLKIKQLFDLFSKTKKNFKKEKKKFYNQYKKLVWKRKKRRNRKKTGLLHFLRRRRRMLYKYYVPRHLEINYKTLDIAHLGQFDSLTTNSRITFWLNLRRLMTFLSL